MEEYRCYGAPGCGKTSYLSRQVHRAAEVHGPENILVASFTRAAAAELSSRKLPLPADRVGTLHAHAYRALGHPQLVEPKHLRQWNEQHGDRWPLSEGLTREEKDNHEWRCEGDKYLNALEVLRAQRKSDRKWFDPELWFFAEEWQRFKDDLGLMDFTDLIEQALEKVPVAPGNPKVGMFDEVQDFTPLELTLVRAWGEHMDYILLAGDPQQCQPTGTVVRTTTGDVPIEMLTTNHRVISYVRADGELILCGRKFIKASRAYSGVVYDIAARGFTSTCTPNHKWLVKWNDRAKSQAHVVYLMRKGDRWRIGWCKLFQINGTFHLGMRARIECADAVWVLAVTDNRTEASLLESYYATEYGLPLVTFREVNGAQHYTQATLDRLFGMLSNQTLRAEHLLKTLGLDIQYPLWHRDRVHRGGLSIHEIHACNILSGYMQIPVPIQDSRRVEWCTLTRTTKTYHGLVWSLDVDRDHTYIADGLVTHNCIYGFKGASPLAFMNPPLPADHKRILGETHRYGRAIHAYAEAWAMRLHVREPLTYAPKDEDGAVLKEDGLTLSYGYGIVKRVRELLQTHDDVMILASCAYHLSQRDGVLAALRDAGIPFHNPYARHQGMWNPLNPGRGVSTAQRVAAFLGKNGRLWTGRELALWAPMIRAEGVFKHGKKAEAALLDTPEPLAYDELGEYIGADSLEAASRWDARWLLEHATPDYQKRLAFPLAIAEQGGTGALTTRPRVITGTVHSVKGGESAAVILFPDLSPRGYEQYQSGPDGEDATIRQFYVGLTRAKETLVIGGGENNVVRLP